jgi:hypothetical protein
VSHITIDGIDLQIRPYHQADYGFVLDAWLKNYKDHSSTSPSMYWNEQKLAIDHLLEHAYTYVLCSPDDKQALHGFVCGEMGRYIHYVYIPFKLRKNGLARELIRYLLGSYPDTIVSSHAGFGASKRFMTNEHLLRLGR